MAGMASDSSRLLVAECFVGSSLPGLSYRLASQLGDLDGRVFC